MIAQVGIALFGVCAIWLSQSKSGGQRRYACLFGLAGQPFWFWSAFTAEQWGIFALCFLYTFSWLRGFKTHWIDHAIENTKTGSRESTRPRDYPNCSGDSASCPENEGGGCCKPNPVAQPSAEASDATDAARYRGLRDLMSFHDQGDGQAVMTLRELAPSHDFHQDWMGRRFEASVDRVADAAIQNTTTGE